VGRKGEQGGLQTAYTRVSHRVRRGVSQLPYPRIRESADGEAAFGEGCLYKKQVCM